MYINDLNLTLNRSEILMSVFFVIFHRYILDRFESLCVFTWIVHIIHIAYASHYKDTIEIARLYSSTYLRLIFHDINVPINIARVFYIHDNYNQMRLVKLNLQISQVVKSTHDSLHMLRSPRVRLGQLICHIHNFLWNSWENIPIRSSNCIWNTHIHMYIHVWMYTYCNTRVTMLSSSRPPSAWIH